MRHTNTHTKLGTRWGLLLLVAWTGEACTSDGEPAHRDSAAEPDACEACEEDAGPDAGGDADVDATADASHDAAPPDQLKSRCEWVEDCDTAESCRGKWFCDALCGFKGHEDCRPDYCCSGEECTAGTITCGADEFCSERSVCGAPCTKAEGCAGDPCLGDESCAADEYCSDAETCAKRCTDPARCLRQACAGDESCGADEYCPQAERCAPRCDSAGCAGPEMRRGHDDRPFHVASWPVVSDGTRIYYLRQYGAYSDPSGEGGDVQGMLTVWDLGSPPEQVLRATYVSWPGLWVQDGYLYMLRTVVDPTFVRAPVADPQHSELIAGANGYPTQAWFTEDSVWWSTPAATLWRSPRAGSLAPEQVATAEHEGWIAGNSTRVFRYVDSGAARSLIAELLPDLTTDERFGTHEVLDDGRATLAVDEEAVFVSTGEDGAQLVRISLGSGESAAVAPPEDRTRNVVLEGAWVYWGAEHADGTRSIQRRPRDLGAQAQELARGALDPRLFTLASGALVYFMGDRFFVKALPDAP